MVLRIENDPYPGFDQQLDHGPVTWSPEAGLWFITGYEEAVAVGSDIQRFSVRHGYRDAKGERFLQRIEGQPLQKWSDGLLRFSDPPNWSTYRSWHEASVPYRALSGPESRPQALRDQFQALVSTQLERVRNLTSIEAMREWCQPLPCLATMSVLGMPLEDFPRLREWVLNGILIVFRNATDCDFLSDESIDRANRAIVELEQYCSELFARKKSAPGDDFISRLLDHQSRNPGTISDYQVFQVVTNHLLGGFHESSMALLADGIHLLLSTNTYQDLVADASLVQGAVEEMLRFHPYAPITLRKAKEDVLVGGQTIKRGDLCLVNVGAAQRDPRKFKNGRVFDIRRPGESNGDLTFGWGPHQCTGRPQIRMLANVFFETLTRSYPQLRIPEWPEGCYMRLRYQPRQDIVLLESLPLVLSNS
ncbi:MAG: cytochrome P450 [Planctomycetes bacterium]|nr:cytochrome P450 [Planctomycetota bacterium]